MRLQRDNILMSTHYITVYNLIVQGMSSLTLSMREQHRLSVVRLEMTALPAFPDLQENENA